MTPPSTTKPDIAIIGSGPAGLMAAEVLTQKNYSVAIFDAMPAPGRKFLRAGVGGLNITRAGTSKDMLPAYGAAQNWIAPFLHAFGPEHIRAWADALGAETFVGSSAKVFPKVMKAAPLLRSWLQSLSTHGATLHLRHTWLGWAEDGALRFSTPIGPQYITPKATILALGGASWPRLGSTGSWTSILSDHGVNITPWQPANCGFNVNWSPYFLERFVGTPIPTAIFCHGNQTLRSTATITKHGLEGHGIYALSATLRDTIRTEGKATLTIDLAPDRNLSDLTAKLSKAKGSRSFSTHLKRCIGFDGVRSALLREVIPEVAKLSPVNLAKIIKALPINCISPRPIVEAISSAGGVSLEAIDKNFMLKSIPNVYCTGEMLDWEAPTGGYLLSGCLALGRAAGLQVATQIT